MNLLQRALHFACLFLHNKEGQDLVEYSLVFSLIGLGAVTGMGYLATGLNEVFSTVSSTLTANV
jgi:Flp pilus assembly pilin Flp